MTRSGLLIGLMLALVWGGCSGDAGKATSGRKTGDGVPSAYHTGLERLEEGNVRGAIRQFERSVEVNPDHLDAYWKLAECYLRMEIDKKDYSEKAQAIYDELAQRLPDDNRRLLKARANLLVSSWKIDEALAMYEEVLAKEPENCEFWTLYARAQWYKSQEVTETLGINEGMAVLDESLQSYEHAAETCPDYLPAHEGIMNILTQRKLYDEVVVIASDLKSSHPDDPHVLRLYTLAQYRARDWARAAEAYEELLKRDPIPSDHLNYAAVLRKLERFEEAEEQLRIYEEVAPKPEGPEHRSRLDVLREELQIEEAATRAAGLIEEEKYDEAIAVWREAADRVRARLEDPEVADESRELLVWLERRIRYAEDLKQKPAQ